MAPPAPTSTDGWVEPTAALVLRWGSYSTRLLAGGALALAGALLIVQTTAYTTPFGWLGAALHVAGWTILPAGGGRRMLAAVLSLLTFVTMLSGASLAWLAAIPLALWLLVRRRPWRSYVTVPLPALVALLMLTVFGPFVGRTILFTVVLSSAVAGGWIARSIAIRERSRIAPRSGQIDSFPH